MGKGRLDQMEDIYAPVVVIVFVIVIKEKITAIGPETFLKPNNSSPICLLVSLISLAFSVYSIRMSCNKIVITNAVYFRRVFQH